METALVIGLSITWFALMMQCYALFQERYLRRSRDQIIDPLLWFIRRARGR